MNKPEQNRKGAGRAREAANPASVDALLARFHAHRSQQNPRYSLRAFARDLGISPAFLSRILDGSRQLSVDAAAAIAKALDLPPADRERFMTVAALASAKSPDRKAMLESSLRAQTATAEYVPLAAEQFCVLSRWYYAAICQVLPLLKGPHTNLSIARRLGLQPLEVEVAIAKLLAAGMLVREGRRLRQVTPKVAAGETPSSRVRAWHDQWLTKARSALVAQPFADRDFSGTMLRFDTKRMDEARALIKNFRRQFAELVGGETADAVFHLGVQFWRVDRPVAELATQTQESPSADS